MEKTKGSYEAKFPVGTRVQIADRATLERFMCEVRHLHSLATEQLELADQISCVEAIGYYHEGVKVYKLEEISGMWHEGCLRAVASKGER